MKSRGRRPRTLSIDIGGSGLKASVLDPRGRMTAPRRRVPTPARCTPATLMTALDELIAPLPAFDRVSVGFPGVVRDGVIVTAPPFRDHFPARFPLARALRRRWDKPVRIVNDADMQGLAAARGKGLELVVTLGTGVGTALFLDGTLLPHLELAMHPCLGAKTYNNAVGDAALERLGRRAWNARAKRALEMLRTIVNYDRLYVGGGNAKKLTFTLPNMRRVSNRAGILGGIALWTRHKEGPAHASERKGRSDHRRRARHRTSHRAAVRG